MNSLKHSLSALLILAASLGATAQAATVGYWRFENSAAIGEDSSGNNLTLTNNNGVTSVSTPFSNPIPQTGASNLLATDYEANNSSYLSIADNALFAFQDFTIEAYVRIESHGSSQNRIIASQLNSGTGASLGWQFGVTNTGSSYGSNRLFLQTSADGTTSPVIIASTAAFTMSLNTNYYVAASVDFTSGVGMSITYYLQDLTNGGSLINSTGSASGNSSLFDSTANFAIGTSYTSGAASRLFDGVIDEVRLSNTALSSSELLAVPEPSVWALGMLGGAVVLIAVRRGRSRGLA